MGKIDLRCESRCTNRSSYALQLPENGFCDSFSRELRKLR